MRLIGSLREALPAWPGCYTSALNELVQFMIPGPRVHNKCARRPDEAIKAHGYPERKRVEDVEVYFV